MFSVFRTIKINSFHFLGREDKNFTRNVETLPVISISKLRLPIDRKEPKEHIKKIVDDYNENLNQTKKRNKTKKTKKKQKPEYEAVDKNIINNPIIKANSDVYVQTVVNRSKVMGSLLGLTGNDHEYMEKRYNIAIFYYCSDNSVYAITTNSAWTLVQNYRDPEFPQKIADRLLTLVGPKDHSNKPLFSDISKTSVRRKDEKKPTTDALDEPHIRLNYAARLRNNASIYKLNCFLIKEDNSPVNVVINYGSIRFLCLIKVDSLRDVIEHLHRIYNKEPTRIYNKEPTTTDEVEQDSKVYRQYLRVPDFQIRNDLNVHLVEILRKSIQDNDDDAIENFELMHSKMDDFLDATQFKMIYKTEEMDIGKVPNLKHVIQTLRTDPLFHRIRNRDNEFRKELKRIHISFNSKTEQINDELLNFLEGIIAYNHLYYFRAFKKWYYISEDFYRHIQDAFVSCLQNDLLAGNSKAQLKHVWKDDIDEGPYNDGYMNRENFLVGDRTLTDTGIEIFDLLFHDKSSQTTYLYHVKDGFNQSTRVAQDQLCNSALIIRNHFHNIDKHILNNYYKQIVKNYEKNEWHLPDIFAEFDDFQKLLENPSKIVFVYAVRIKLEDISQAGDAKEGAQLKHTRALAVEKDIKNKISAPVIEKSIKALPENNRKSLARALKLHSSDIENNVNLSKDIFEKLTQTNYIKRIDGSETEAYVNSSLLLSTLKDFEISGVATDVARKIIYNKILRNYRTNFKSLSAKLSVLKMKNQIEGIHHYRFKICEIIGEKTTKTDQSQNMSKKRKSNESTHANKNQKIHDANEDLPPTPGTSQTIPEGN